MTNNKSTEHESNYAVSSVTYGITEEKFSLGARKRTSYGIAAYGDADIDGTATVLLHVSDITCERDRITELVELCNRMKVSVLHLHDVVQDFLAS